MKSLPSKYESVMQRKRFKQQWKQVKDEKKEKATKKIRTMSHFSFFFMFLCPFRFSYDIYLVFLCGLNLRFFIFCGKSRKSIFFLSALNPVESYPVSCDFFLYPQSDTNRTKLFFVKLPFKLFSIIAYQQILFATHELINQFSLYIFLSQNHIIF